MNLTTEELDEMLNVEAEILDEVLREDAFGKFVVLNASEEEFIQAGNDWQPTEECSAYLKEFDSDPWVLEVRVAGRLYRAERYATLAQVRHVFGAYLTGKDWRSSFKWSEIQL